MLGKTAHLLQTPFRSLDHGLNFKQKSKYGLPCKTPDDPTKDTIATPTGDLKIQLKNVRGKPATNLLSEPRKMLSTPSYRANEQAQMVVSQRHLLSIHNQSEGNTSSLSQFEKIDFQSRYLKKLELSLQQQVDSQMCTSISKIRSNQMQHSRKSRGLTPKGNSMQTDTRPSIMNEKYIDA